MENWNFDTAWQRKKAEETYFADCREIQKAAAKTAAVELIRIQSLQIKQNLREQERERKKSMQEIVQIMEDGTLCMVTQNLRIEPMPRYITNMKRPTLTVLKRAEDVNEEIYRVSCSVNEKEKKIFLAKSMSGNGSYLLRKFGASGICFLCSTAEAKKIAVQVLAILLSEPDDEELLPDMAGWMKKPDNTFTYIDEGEMTWKEAKNLSK